MGKVEDNQKEGKGSKIASFFYDRKEMFQTEYRTCRHSNGKKVVWQRKNGTTHKSVRISGQIRKNILKKEGEQYIIQIDY